MAGGGNGATDGAALFAAGIAARTRGRVLWCVTRQDLFAPALASAGLAPDRVIYAKVEDEKTVLACFEEGLRHGRGHGESHGGGSCSRALPCHIFRPPSPSPQGPHKGEGRSSRRRQTLTSPLCKRRQEKSNPRIIRIVSASLRRPSRAGASARCFQCRCRLRASGAPAGGSNSSGAAAAKAPVSTWRLVMRRVVSLFLPTWSTDRVRTQLDGAAPPADAPLVLAGRQGAAARGARYGRGRTAGRAARRHDHDQGADSRAGSHHQEGRPAGRKREGRSTCRLRPCACPGKPWQIFASSAVRDYFRVENDAGERFWIYRAGDGEDRATGSHRWFLHGIFG